MTDPSPRYYTLDEEHHLVPATLEQWAETFKHPDSRRIARDEIGDVIVSTVFLGLDHGWGEGPPICFETMTFRGGKGQDCHRYSSWDDAITGHACAVKRAGGKA